MDFWSKASLLLDSMLATLTSIKTTKKYVRMLMKVRAIM